MTNSDSSMGYSFSASYDLTTKLISALVFAIFICGAGFSGQLMVGVVGFLLVGISYALSTRGYAVSSGMLWVKRPFWSMGIPLHDIREVRAATPDDLRGCIRVFGNGGLFGYYGVFRTSALGICHWNVTNRSKAVVLLTRSKTFVLSPDDVNSFAETIKVLAPTSSDASTHTNSAMPSGRRTSIAWTAIAIAIMGVVVVLGVLAWRYSPGAPRYTLNREGLTIHDRFYPVSLRAADIEVDQIRVVDIANDPHWRPVMRTNGFANAHYRAGWFKVAGGEKIRMYRAEARRLVLLPPKGDMPPVLLEVRQPDAFIQEVRNIWK
jgi:hypothetical protein